MVVIMLMVGFFLIAPAPRKHPHTNANHHDGGRQLKYGSLVSLFHRLPKYNPASAIAQTSKVCESVAAKPAAPPA